MELYFRTKKMEQSCSCEREMRKKWGIRLAKKFQQRLLELKAAETLADISKMPPARCHELTGDRKGQLSVDVEQPYRLIFEPFHNPVPKKEVGGLDWSRVCKIIVLEIVDTH